MADHSGWTVLVSVATVNGTPAVVDRRRVALIDEGVPTQPYHHETLTLGDAESEKLLRKVKRSIAARTAAALDAIAADLSPEYHVAAIAIRQPTLDPVPATVAEIHRSYHALSRADGMLYHSAICSAARERGWTVVFHRRGEELARASAALNTSLRQVERLVNEPRRALGPPWTAEHRNAFAAAISALPNRR